MEDIKQMSREQRIAFYQRHIKLFTPPHNRRQEVLLKVYRQLLESAQDDGNDDFQSHFL